jgi:hypothetical protein
MRRQGEPEQPLSLAPPINQKLKFRQFFNKKFLEISYETTLKMLFTDI